MSKVNRYKLDTTPKLKRVHKAMLSKFEIRNIKPAKKAIYFTIINEEEIERIEKFLSERGIRIFKLEKNGKDTSTGT